MLKDELVSEVSKHSDIRADVVAEVIDALTDVAIEEIINTGEFNFPRILSLHTREWGNTPIGNNPHTRLMTNLTPTIKVLRKLKRENPNLKINRSNWKKIYRAEDKRIKTPKGPPKQSNANDEMLDEFLEDFQ